MIINISLKVGRQLDNKDRINIFFNIKFGTDRIIVPGFGKRTTVFVVVTAYFLNLER